MKIDSSLSSYVFNKIKDAYYNANRVNTQKSGAERAAAPPSTNVHLSDFTSAREIMSKYDVRSISFNDTKKMATELYQKGHLKEIEYMQLTKPPGDFSEITGQPKPDLNEPHDLIKTYENKISFQRARGAEEKSIEYNEKMLSLLRKLEYLHG